MRDVEKTRTTSMDVDGEDSRDSGFESSGGEMEDSPAPREISFASFNFGEDIISIRKRGKRCCGESQNNSVPAKRPRAEVSQPVSRQLDAAQSNSVGAWSMKSVVDKMSADRDLVGDGSHTHHLPTICGRHKDLKAVSPGVVSQLLAGTRDGVVSGYQIVDCRYPYEYEKGHIKGAVNIHNEGHITELLSNVERKKSCRRNILVFHCEFSSERAPRLLRYLRNLDRKLNRDYYPFLLYPEVYLLEGGYNAFYQQCQSLCEPMDYVPMMHQDYSTQLRHFRSKSKSWTADEEKIERSQHLRSDLSSLKCQLW